MVVYRERLANSYIEQLLPTYHCPDEYSRFTQFYHYADEYSKFTQVREVQYAYNSDYGLSIPISCSVHYYIDANEVGEQTFNEVMIKVQNDYEIRINKRCEFQIIEDGVGETTWQLNIGDDNMTWLDYMKEVNYPGYGRRIEHSFTDGWYSEWYKTLLRELDDYDKKCEVNDMNKNITITNYKYDEKTATTTIFWSDKSQSSVTADNVSEATEFEGFCAACAKKLFGNKSTYLNQFDKWTVKKPEQEKKKVELEKAKAEEQAKINAEKAERAKARKIKRLAKKWANDYKTTNERLEIYEAAEKLAKEKYGVPNEYFEDGFDCGCECGCKEFDVMGKE